MRKLSPIAWGIRPLKRYADFSGRSPRAEYWWFVLAVGLTGFVLGLIDGAVLGGPVLGGYGPLGLVWTLGILVPSLAVTVRRLHDIDRTGWWAVFKAASYVYIFLALSAAGVGPLTQESMSLPLIALLIICGFGGLVLFFFLISEGEGCANRYGPDPYGSDQLEEVFA